MATAIEVRYSLSAMGQRVNLLAGGDGKPTQTVSVAHGDPSYADAVALAPVGSSGPGAIRCDLPIDERDTAPGEQVYSSDFRAQPKLYDSTPTVATLLADESARRAGVAERYAAKKEADTAAHEAEVARVLSANAAELLEERYGEWSIRSGPWSDPRTENTQSSLRGECHRRNIEAKERRDREKSEKAAAQAAEIERLAAWTREHGSALAKARLAEGYGTWVSQAKEDYADAECERVMSFFTAGCTPADSPDGYAASVEDRKSPTLGELNSLRSIRSQISGRPGVTASLLRVTYTPNDGPSDDADEIVRTELRLTVTVPGAGEVDRDYIIPE